MPTSSSEFSVSLSDFRKSSRVVEALWRTQTVNTPASERLLKRSGAEKPWSTEEFDECDPNRNLLRAGGLREICHKEITKPRNFNTRASERVPHCGVVGTCDMWRRGFTLSSSKFSSSAFGASNMPMRSNSIPQYILKTHGTHRAGLVTDIATIVASRGGSIAATQKISSA